jgi:hypothetical protein
MDARSTERKILTRFSRNPALECHERNYDVISIFSEWKILSATLLYADLTVILPAGIFTFILQ